MKKIIGLLVFYIFSAIVALASKAPAKDKLVGYYKGTIEGATFYPLNVDKNIYLEVFRDINGYRLKFLSDIMRRTEIHEQISNIKVGGSEIVLKNAGKWNLSGNIKPTCFELKGKKGKKDLLLTFKKMEIVSPTMGKKAPSNAIILFDGTNRDEWVQCKDSSECCWILNTDKNEMESIPYFKDGKKFDGSIKTKKKFGAVRLHLEFKIPVEYDSRLYGRGNSGLYFGPYEIQIIDSFGGEGDFGECASIYRLLPAKVNASLEPGTWQTFDVEFYPAKFKGDTVIRNPMISLWHNGVRVHYFEEVERPTVLSLNPNDYKHPKGKLPISLQDHSYPVAFRNIWVEEINE